MYTCGEDEEDEMKKMEIDPSILHSSVILFRVFRDAH